MTETPEKKKIRVLVVDDSAYNRRNIADIFLGSPDAEVVGKAADGEEALRLVTSLKPDVITLDLEMPRMDGFTFLRILMAKQPTPVIVVSSYRQKENVFKALELGALDFVAKPDRQISPDATDVKNEILQKVLMVRNLRASTAISRPPRVAPRELLAQAPPPAALPQYLIGIASSTGGPTALLEIFGKLPERLSAGVLVAQHMPDKFTRTFAERLDKKGVFRVAEAQDGDLVTTKSGFVCPGRQCMELTVNASGTELKLRTGSPGSSDRYVPSADRLFRSMALSGGPRVVGVVLTGMGDDGLLGARAVREAGGTVVVESQETAVVYGMPGAVARAGLADQVLPLPALVEWLCSLGS